MSKVSISATLAAPAERVWALIGGFNSLPEWSGAISSSALEEGGRLRRMRTPDGAVVVERLETFSESERYYSYSIVEAPLPVTNYHATLKVIPVFGRQQCIVEWSSSYYTTPELEDKLNAAFSRLYQGGLDNLKKTLGV